MRSAPFRVAVIGAGVSGLAAAHRLREGAATRELPLEVTVLEACARAGGPLRTLRQRIGDDEVVIETGADSFLSEKPWALDLARRLGLDAEMIGTDERFRKTYVVRAGRLVEIPEGFSLLAPSRLGSVLRSPLFSFTGKLRIALEPLLPRRRGTSDESLASFVTRRLGREVLERIAQPLAGGIYAADPNRLSLAATTPRFIEMERRHGSVIRGLRRSMRAAPADARSTSGARWSLFVSFKGGMQALADALASRLSGCIRRGAEVGTLERSSGRWRVRLRDRAAFDADAIICAVPAYVAATMLHGVEAQLAARLGAIAYASAATVNVAYRVSNFPRPPDYFGFVVPAIEKRKIIAGSFTSVKFRGRAPDGLVIVRAFLGGVLQSQMMQLDDRAMVAAAREEFAALLGVSAPPLFATVQRWPDSMPQYQVGHLDRVEEIERASARLPRFALAGAYLRGIGIPDCVHSGERAADLILESLFAGRGAA